MKIVYVVTLCGLLLCANIQGICARGKGTSLARALLELLLVVDVTVLSSMLAILIPIKSVALFLQCTHYASTEWLLIFLLRFLELYTGQPYKNRLVKNGVYCLSAASSIFLFLNIWFGHIVTCEYVDIGGGSFCQVFTVVLPWYRLHLYFCFFLLLFNLLMLRSGVLNTPAFYRKKYLPAAVMLFITFGMEGVCSVLGFPLDYPLYFYILLVIFLTYYSMYHVPKGLINETLSHVVTELSGGVACFDFYGTCIYANEEVESLYQNGMEQAALEDGFGGLAEERDFSTMEERTWDRSFETAEGKRYYEITFRKLRDKEQNYIGCYFYLYDKTQDVENLVKEHHRATHDSLTDLYTQDYFCERVRWLLAHELNEEYVIFSSDIKDFKLINDMFGYEVGNKILVRLADNIRSVLPKHAVCGRLSGDRFAFCVAREDFSEERLLDCIQQTEQDIHDEECQMNVHVHVGVYEVKDKDTDVSIMCDRARMALRVVKEDYEKVFAYYDESMMQKLMREKYLVGEFERALEEKQFVMYLQPQVAPDGTVLGAEALVRWIHPEQGMIPPGEFISVFEHVGLIHRLDAYMWEEAAARLHQWKEQGKEQYHISVNISTKDFHYLDIYQVFTGLVEKYDISPEKLKLEITESALMSDQEKQLALLERLQAYGFHIEIDDFGSGYSSLNMLKDMRADVLKIDMGFLRETQERERTRIILNMVVNLAKRLNMTVVTEGVENKVQVEYLTQVGCDMFQGYYFDRPIPVEDFEQRYLLND